MNLRPWVLSYVDAVILLSTTSTLRVSGSTPSLGKSQILNFWQDGHEINRSASTTSITSNDGWLAIGLSPGLGECRDLNGQALRIKYTAFKTDPKKLEIYHSINSNCQIVNAQSCSAYVNFLQDFNELIVPLSVFRIPDASLAHALVIRGQLQVHQIELVDSRLAYGPQAITAETLHSSAKHFPLSIESVFPTYREMMISTTTSTTDNHDVVLENDDNGFEEFLSGPDRCVDMRNRIIKITYSASFTGLRHVSLVHKAFICENLLKNQIHASILFLEGTNNHVCIPSDAFASANLALGYTLRIHGPLTIHQVELIHPQESEFTHQNSGTLNGQVTERLVDEFTDWTKADENNLGFARLGSGYVGKFRDLSLDHQSSVWTEQISESGLSYDMTNAAFMIKYSARTSGYRSLTLIQDINLDLLDMTLLWYKGTPIPTRSVYTNVMVFAGIDLELVIPISVFSTGNPIFNPEYACGLSINGPISLHSIKIMHNLPLHLVPNREPIPSESITGSPVVIEDFTAIKSALRCWIRSMLHGRVLYYGSFRRLADQDLQTDPIESAGSIKIADMNAFRVTYTATQSNMCRIVYLEYVPGEVYVKFEEGKNRVIVIPFSIFGRSRYRGKYDYSIYGPFTKIEKVELVKTSYAATELPAWNGRMGIGASRQNVFNKAFEILMAFGPPELRHELTIVFDNEKGLDLGGLLKEFFYLLSKEITSPALGLFRATSLEANFALEIDPMSDRIDDYLDKFKFVGRIIGLAILHNKVLNVHFGTPLYKMILGHKMTIRDLKQIDPIVYKHLMSIRDMDVTEAFGLYLQDTDDIAVTNTNKHIYIANYWYERIWNSVRIQATQIRRGVLDVIPDSWLQSKNAVELQRLVEGCTRIDVDSWKRYTVYEGGYDESHPTIQMFWECVEQWSNEQRRLLLKYVTASEHLPPTGFKGLDFPFMIRNDKKFTEFHLPATYTCGNILILPPYDCIHTVRYMLEYSIKESASYELDE